MKGREALALDLGAKLEGATGIEVRNLCFFNYNHKTILYQLHICHPFVPLPTLYKEYYPQHPTSRSPRKAYTTTHHPGQFPS